MPIPFFPLLGMSPHLMLLDPRVVFTPLLCGGVLLAGLCGLGVTMLLDRMYGVPKQAEARPAAPSSFSKAA